MRSSEAEYRGNKEALVSEMAQAATDDRIRRAESGEKFFPFFFDSGINWQCRWGLSVGDALLDSGSGKGSFTAV